jgi:type I restriction enzyme S subunit
MSRLPPGWTATAIRSFAERIERRVSGAPEHVLMIASRSGFVPQSDKYARFMAGQSLQRYIELRRGEFAYNKGNSATYPCGCVYRLKSHDSAAVPFVYFCFSVDGSRANPAYLEHYFAGGGLNAQLRGKINSGVRNNGLLNIRADEFFSCDVPLPPLSEQRKIAAILSSVDEAIEKTQAVIDQVQVVKKGLMQELLTRGLPGRHKKFKKTEIGEIPADWEVRRLGDLATIGNGSTPSRRRTDFWSGGTIPWLPTGKVNDRVIRQAEQYVTQRALEECPIRLLPPATLLIAMIGQGKTRGMVAYLATEATVNQNFAYVCCGSSVRSWFLFAYLEHRYESLRSSGRGSNQDALNCGIIKRFEIPVPPIDEQDRIAEALLQFNERLETEQLHGDAIAAVKSALMSVLLTGEVRVKPDPDVAA